MWKSLRRWLTTEPPRAGDGNNTVPGPISHAAGERQRLFDPQDPGFIADPYPYFETLRNNHPLYRNHLGIWVLTRYRDVTDALADRRLVNTPSRYALVHPRNRGKYVCADVANNTLPFMEGDTHQRLRKIIAPVFHTWLREMPFDMEAMALDILKPYRDKNGIDILHDYATPLSLQVLCRVLGFPDDDGPQLKTWSDYFFYLFSVMPSQEVRIEVDRALTEFRIWTAGIVEQRKQHRGNDLISRLLDARDQGAGFSDQELIDNCMLLFADGIGNVDSGFANVIACLLAHPEQLAMLYEDRSLVPQAVDEGLRYESPAQFIARVADEDIEWHGETIRKDQAVFLVLASANRDPDKFHDADGFDILRGDNNDYISFGRGAHSCLGARLVKMQMQAALRAVLREWTHLRPASGELHWRTRFGHRWLKHLHVTFEASSETG